MKKVSRAGGRWAQKQREADERPPSVSPSSVAIVTAKISKQHPNSGSDGDTTWEWMSITQYIASLKTGGQKRLTNKELANVHRYGVPTSKYFDRTVAFLRKKHLYL